MKTEQEFSKNVGKLVCDIRREKETLSLIVSLFRGTNDVWNYEYYMLNSGVSNFAPCVWFTNGGLVFLDALIPTK